MDKSTRFTTIGLTAAVIASLLSVPLLKFAWSAADIWIRITLRPPNTFYINSWMSGWVWMIALAGPIVVILIVISVLACLRPSWPRWPVIALPLAITIALCSMVILPNVPFWESELLRNSIHLSSIEHSLLNWSRTSGRFPTTQNELDNALLGEKQTASIYVHDNHDLKYQLRFVPNQDGPYSTRPEQPGIVYYAVSQSGNQFWLTISGLNAAIGNHASMMHVDPFTASKQPWGNLLVASDTHVSVQKQ